MKKRFLHILCSLGLILAVLASPPLAARPAPETPPVGVQNFNRKPGAEAISPQDAATIARVEAYLNGLHTLQAHFLQTTADGGVREGRVWLARPGKMRLEYAGAVKNLLVADGSFIHVWDDQAKTSSSVPLASSLAAILLRDPLHLSGDVAVMAVKNYPARIEITLVQRDNAAAGSLTMEFEDKPLRLISWRVLDASGAETRVALDAVQEGGTIPDSLFFYREPDFGHHK